MPQLQQKRVVRGIPAREVVEKAFEGLSTYPAKETRYGDLNISLPEKPDIVIACDPPRDGHLLVYEARVLRVPNGMSYAVFLGHTSGHWLTQPLERTIMLHKYEYVPKSGANERQLKRELTDIIDESYDMGHELVSATRHGAIHFNRRLPQSVHLQELVETDMDQFCLWTDKAKRETRYPTTYRKEFPAVMARHIETVLAKGDPVKISPED